MSLIQSLQILTETRRSAFVRYIVNSDDYSHAPWETADRLMTLKTLNALGAINVTSELEAILAEQSLVIENKTLWGWPYQRFANIAANTPYITDLCQISDILSVLKLFGVLDRVNRTALLDIVMLRYNASDGAFYEPIVTVKTEHGEYPHTACGFPMVFPGGGDIAYARPNMITTYLAISILVDLYALDLINATKTVEWVLSCKASNGGFKPFPSSEPTYLPAWSRFVTNSFDVDDYGAGLPFTFAAVRTLRLFELDINSILDVNQTRDYVLSCKVSMPGDAAQFEQRPKSTAGGDGPSTYHAVTVLRDIGVLDAEIVSETTAYLLHWEQDYTFRYDGSWPVPGKLYEDRYGGFPSYGHWGIFILNTTSNLFVLDEATPIVSKTWTNLISLSALASVSATGFSAMSLLTYNRIQMWKEKKNSQMRPSVVA